jgi:membrane fusion protein (multidrug efflux system)
MTNPLPCSSPPPSPPPPNHHRQKMAIWITVAIFVLCGLAYWIYWLGWGQYSESTDDAYVNGNMILLTPQEEGIVTTILVDNTQLVEEGQVIVELDPHDHEIALQRAKAELADAVRLVVQLFLKVEELEAKREKAKAELMKAILDYGNRQPLVEDGSVTKEEFEHSETALYAAFGSLKEVEKELQGAHAEVRNTTIATHPKVEQAKATVRDAFLGLHRCHVLAPTRGIITQRRCQVGQWVRAQDPLMALVPIQQIWVDANFREVSIKNLRIGQPVKLVSDMYGDDVIYHGEVVGLNPGTGSVFSILPPQNATGNWIKIIQRIPVKICLDPDELKAHPLVLGLTMTATIDTHARNGLQLPHVLTSTKPIYHSDVYTDELKGADDLIAEIIKANSPDKKNDSAHQ